MGVVVGHLGDVDPPVVHGVDRERDRVAGPDVNEGGEGDSPFGDRPHDVPEVLVRLLCFLDELIELTVGEVGLLVLCSLNSEATWDSRGAPEVPDMRYPLVIFAVRPSVGQIGTWEGRLSQHTHPRAVWYRCLLPAETSELFDHQHVARPHPDETPGSHVRYALIVRSNASAGISLLLDATGREVYGRRIISDGYEADVRGGTLMDDSSIRLGDLPPPLTGP